jgi:NADH:ubiquinone reductase (H+-translocating)
VLSAMSWVHQTVSAADRFQSRRPWTAVPVAVWKKFQDDQAGYLATLVSYYGFVALFPLLLIFVTVLNMTLKSDPAVRAGLLSSALAQYPVIGNDITGNLGTIHASGFALVVGIVVLLLGTRGVAFAMQNALCAIWGIPRGKRPGFPWPWVYGLALVFTIGIGLVVTTFLSGIAGGAGHVLTGFGAHAGAVAVSLIANLGVFWLAFRLATFRQVRWRDLRIGAAIAAVVWQVLQVLGGYVITHELHRASSLYGSFGVVLGLLAWLYLEAEVTLYAAEIDVVLVRRMWPRSLLTQPAPGRDAEPAQAAAPGLQAVPAQAVPAQAVPAPLAPAATVPAKTVPAKTGPAKTGPAQAVPTQGVPVEEGARQDLLGRTSVTESASTIAQQPAADSRGPGPGEPPHVVIVGAGFGGLAAVRGLQRVPVRVTIIDKNLYSTFQPLLYQVATGGLNPGDISYPVGGFATPRHTRYTRGELVKVDAAGRRIRLADGRELGYDYLILATGISTAYYGVKGAAENTFGLYTRADAIRLRDHIMAGFERMSAAGGNRDLTITVVGGGPTGVELAGTLGELRGAVLRATFPDADPSRVHVRLVEMAPSLLTPFDERLRAYACRQLARRGVDVRLGAEIREVRKSSVLLADGQELPSDLTVWAAGVAAPTAAGGWGLPQGKGGRILVGADLRVEGQDRVFAVGDIALRPGKPSPQLAQPAIQEGEHAASGVAGLIAGQLTTAFSYHDRGIMATIGRRSAVVQFPRGARITGTPAWLAWLALHLCYLLGGRNRVSTLIDLSWRYIAWGHGGGGVILGDDPVAPAGAAPKEPDEAGGRP